MWMEQVLIKDPEIAILTTSGWVLAGIMSIAFIYTSSPDLPDKKGCSLYKVDKRPVTAYVLKPPPPEIRYEACPQTTQKMNPFEPSPIVQPPKPSVSPKTDDDIQTNLSATDDTQKPRRHRHRRYRRYWR